MKKNIAFILVGLLFFSSSIGCISYAKESIKILCEMNSNMEYMHTIFMEIATSQNCKNCPEWSENVSAAYNSGDYDFEYVEMIVFDHDGKKLNEKAANWANSYGVGVYPTSIFDGDYERIVGNFPSLLPNALNSCGERTVFDINADMTVLWLEDSTIQVDITIENNEETQYNGHIRASITEIISRYDTYYGDPYHFGFLDFAFDKDIAIAAGGLYSDSITWNGNEHEDNQGNNFGDIDPDNIQVTMGILNNEDGYVDETVMARIVPNNPPNPPSNPSPPDGAVDIEINTDLSWSCSDPDGGLLEYDVYFGTTNPPPQVVVKQIGKTYDPGTMEYNTTYYWKIVAWDNQGASTSGPIWSFAVKEEQSENQPPEIEITKPERALYIGNTKILPRLFGLTFIIGSITIEVHATDEDSGIEKVEFYINGKLKGEDNSDPYTYVWVKDRIRLFHIFLITVKVYDNGGKTSIDRMFVKKLL